MTGVDVEHTKALEAAATPGPWVASVVDSPRSTVSTAIYSHAHPAGTTESEVLPSYPMRPRSSRISRADAEFIAHARTAVPALVAAVERVQALHTPINAADYGVRNRGAITQVCTGCGQDDGNWQYWPCPTIRALEIK